MEALNPENQVLTRQGNLEVWLPVVYAEAIISQNLLIAKEDVQSLVDKRDS